MSWNTSKWAIFQTALVENSSHLKVYFDKIVSIATFAAYFFPPKAIKMPKSSFQVNEANSWLHLELRVVKTGVAILRI